MSFCICLCFAEFPIKKRKDLKLVVVFAYSENSDKYKQAESIANHGELYVVLRIELEAKDKSTKCLAHCKCSVSNS